MTTNIQELMKSANDTLKAVQRFEDAFENVEHRYDPEAVSVDERSQFIQLRRIYDAALDMTDSLKFLQKPILAEGALRKQPNGRYHVDGVELTSGQRLELYDEDDDVFYPTALEHNSNDYYIVLLGRDVSIESKLVRIRQ